MLTASTNSKMKIKTQKHIARRNPHPKLSFAKSPRSFGFDDIFQPIHGGEAPQVYVDIGGVW